MYIQTLNSNWQRANHGLSHWDRLFAAPWGAELAREQTPEWKPACEVEESPEHYLLTLETPGVPKDQLKLEVADQQLVITGERPSLQNGAPKEESGWYTERRYGKFSRTFSLPQGLDLEKVEAKYEDGILKVYLPKAISAKPRQIKLGETSSTGFFSRLLGTNQVA